MKYQGWTNAQTWCIALWFNNQKTTQDVALDIVRENIDNKMTAISRLKHYTLEHLIDIWNMAPWSWSDGQSISADVDWNSIFEHFKMKVLEERLQA
jgi:hypothetical protein